MTTAAGSKPSALVVGGTGFVGPHLARQLGDRYCVMLTGRDHDVRDGERLLKLIAQSAPQLVVNLAAITTVRESVARPREAYDTGFYGLFNLLTALKACNFTGRLLQVSSSEVYGFPSLGELPLTEAAPLRAMSPYAVAKAAAEMLCHQWAHTGSFDILVARPFTHIGPGQSDRFAVAKFAGQIADIMVGRREPVIEVGSLNASRDLTDVRDVARAYDLILHRGRAGEVYNVCSGHEVVMRDVLDNLIRMSGKTIAVVEANALVRAGEQQRLCGSFAKLHEATGWSPAIPLTDTLADVLRAARNGEQSVLAGSAASMAPTTSGPAAKISH